MDNVAFSDNVDDYVKKDSCGKKEIREQTRQEEFVSRKPQLTFYAAWSASFAAFAGLWQYGFAVGAINSAFVPGTKAIKVFYESRYGVEISNATVETIWTVSSAAFPVEGIVGSLLVGPVVVRFGRLNGMVLGHVITVLMCLLCGLSKVLRSPEALIIGRFGVGAMSATVGRGISSMYVVEVTPLKLRGVFGCINSVMISLGFTVANALGHSQILGNDKYWDVLVALAGAPSFLYLVFSRTFARSPRKIFLEDCDKEQTTVVLQRLMGVEDVSRELGELEREKREANSAKQLTVCELITCKKLRKATILAVALGASQQITGFNGVTTNLNNIYIAAGISSYLVYYFSVAVGLSAGLVQILSALLIEKYGRKRLLIVGFAVEGVCLIILTIAMETQHYARGMAFVSVAASIGFLMGFALGPGPVVTLIVAESFNQTTRSAAITLCSLGIWVCFTVTVVITPYMLNSIRGYTFLPYGIMALFIMIYLRVNVQETKGRSFQDVQRSLQRRSSITTITM